MSEHQLESGMDACQAGVMDTAAALAHSRRPRPPSSTLCRSPARGKFGERQRCRKSDFTMDVEPEELLVDKWNETSTSNASMFEYEIGNGTVVLPHFNQTVEGGFIGEDFLREPAMVALAVFALCIPVVCIIGTLVIIR
ncbi:unnamed protein product [Cyprideis torosa]|uniref:Uncharacterized protein n=1 Tax=Cyprideis torosa TaxID=163714 RepID=A0A7R8ZKW4_9CRUS|nr:unnamed protein product [Cyprideis torosa]CAG0892023.1 unnamed protein product [Cyprideis torosa]